MRTRSVTRNATKKPFLFPGKVHLPPSIPYFYGNSTFSYEMIE
ncbi:hypothetical protein ACMTAS_0703 [Thermotoga neapolitana DSM 4359]